MPYIFLPEPTISSSLSLSPSPSPAIYSLLPSYILASNKNTPASLLQPEQSRMNYLNTTSTDTQIQIPLYTNISQQSSVEQPKINTNTRIDTMNTTYTTDTKNIYDNAVKFFSPSS